MDAGARNELVLDLPLTRLLGSFPQLVPFFIQHHLACIGCPYSNFHSLSQALQLHAIVGKRADQLKAQILATCTFSELTTPNVKGERDAT